jgi:hypothetical protein
MENDILHSTPAPSAVQNNDQTRISGQYYDDYRKEKEGNSQNAQSQFYLAICPGCGSAARKEEKFCSQCGLAFGARNASSATLSIPLASLPAQYASSPLVRRQPKEARRKSRMMMTNMTTTTTMTSNQITCTRSSRRLTTATLPLLAFDRTMPCLKS